MTRIIPTRSAPIVLALLLGLTACGSTPWSRPPEPKPAPPAATPAAIPGAAAIPAAGATTAEQFDTTTAEERAAAASGPTGAADAGASIGETVATLGNPADPGFWLETPLVDAPRPGRVVAKATGKSAQVELRPIAGADSAGSRISLPALRLLEVGLTGLHELEVYGG